MLQGRALASTEEDLRAEEEETRRLRREQKGIRLQLEAMTRRTQQLEQHLQAAQVQEGELQRKLVDSGAEVTSTGRHAPMHFICARHAGNPSWLTKVQGSGADLLAGWNGDMQTRGHRRQVLILHLRRNWQLRLMHRSKVGQAGRQPCSPGAGGGAAAGAGGLWFKSWSWQRYAGCKPQQTKELVRSCCSAAVETRLGLRLQGPRAGSQST